MKYCKGSLCFDFYRGANDFQTIPGFVTTTCQDEIARWVSLTNDAFDQVGNGSRQSAAVVSNGDYWSYDSTLPGLGVRANWLPRSRRRTRDPDRSRVADVDQ